MAQALTIGNRDNKTGAQTFIDAVKHGIPAAEQLGYFMETLRTIERRDPEAGELLRRLSLYVGGR
jgi:hypothetical protein